MLLTSTATRRLAATAATRRGAAVRNFGAAAAAAEVDDVAGGASYPYPTTSETSNGVAVASLYDSGVVGSGASYTTVRLSGVGSRYDVKGGEAALLGKLLGASEVGREHMTFTSSSSAALPSLSLDDSSLPAEKAALSASLAASSQYDMLWDHLHATAYQGSPAGDSLANAASGTEESVAAVTADDLRAALANVSSVCVAAAGAGEHAKLAEEAEKAYGGLALGGSGASSEVAAVKAKPFFIGSDVRVRYDSHKSATFALAFEGASHTDPNSLALSLMTALVGTYDASDGLGKNVATKIAQEAATHGLATHLSAFNLQYSDTGLFGIAATAPDNKLDDLLWYTMPTLVHMAHGAGDEEMARAKLVLGRQSLSAFDGASTASQSMATMLSTLGRVVPLDETMARIEALTVDDVKKAAGDAINDKDHALAAVGGIHELPDYNWIRRKSYMLRY